MINIIFWEQADVLTDSPQGVSTSFMSRTLIRKDNIKPCSKPVSIPKWLKDAKKRSGKT